MMARPVPVMKRNHLSQLPLLQVKPPRYLNKRTVGSDLAVSSIEKLDGIESFLAPLTKEAIEKADALLKEQEEAVTFATKPALINEWLANATTRLSTSITEVPHPLASSPVVEACGKATAPNESFTP